MRTCPSCLKKFSRRDDGNCPACNTELIFVGRKKKITVTNKELRYFYTLVRVFDELMVKYYDMHYYSDTSERSHYFRLLELSREFLIRQKEDPRKAGELIKFILYNLFENSELNYIKIYSLADIFGKILSKSSYLALQQMRIQEQKVNFEERNLQHNFNTLQQTVLAL